MFKVAKYVYRTLEGGDACSLNLVSMPNHSAPNNTTVIIREVNRINPVIYQNDFLEDLGGLIKKCLKQTRRLLS
jgi:hypothetical protein